MADRGTDRGDEALSFPGFRPLSANFTPTPNQFFDEILGRYPLRVVTVVGILIRATLGWIDELTGEKRIEAELPLSAFLRPELSESSARQGLREAIAAGFVVETATHTNRDGARYALRWADTDAQREAIERHRRSMGDRRPFTDQPAPDPESGGVKSGGPNIGPLISGGPNSTPLYIKKRSSEKERVCKTQRKETLNVPDPASIDKSRGGNAHGRTLSAVQIAVTLTGDEGSRARFLQLRQICEENACEDAWSEALRSTEKALTVGRLRQPPGAYFNGTLAKLLETRSVYVPVGSAEERHAVRADLFASLATVQKGPNHP